MNSFQTITLVIAVVLLILILTYLGVKMSSYGKNKNIIEFPVRHNICPDRWGFDGTGCIPPGSDKPNHVLLSRSEFPKGSTLTCNDPSITDMANCTGNYPPYTWTAGSGGAAASCSNDLIDNQVDCETVIPRVVDYSSFNPLSEEWIRGGKSAICAKKEWANTSGILWDGVSNYTKC